MICSTKVYCQEHTIGENISEEYFGNKKASKKLKKIIRKQIESYLTEEQIDRIDYSQEKEIYFCNQLQMYIRYYNINDGDLYREILLNSNCNLKDYYFRHSIHLPKELYPNVRFYSKSYENINEFDIEKLVSSVKGGGAKGGHAAKELSLLGRIDDYDEIYNLRYDKNTFTQWTSVQAAIYFDKYDDAMEIADSILDRELNCLEEKKRSCTGSYAFLVANSILEIDPAYALRKLYELYISYLAFYSEEYNANFFHHVQNDARFRIDEKTGELIPSEVEKQICSFQWMDQSIERRIDLAVREYPHWEKNEYVKLIRKLSKERRAIYNK